MERLFFYENQDDILIQSKTKKAAETHHNASAVYVFRPPCFGAAFLL